MQDDMKYPDVPLALLERLEQDALTPPPEDTPEGVLREYIGRLRTVRHLRLRYEEAHRPED